MLLITEWRQTDTVFIDRKIKIPILGLGPREKLKGKIEEVVSELFLIAKNKAPICGAAATHHI